MAQVKMKKVKPKGAMLDLQKGLGGVLDSVRCMEKDNSDNLENSYIILEKFEEYNVCIKEIIANLIRLDGKMSTNGIMVQKMPELNRFLIQNMKKYSFDLSPYHATMDLMSKSIEDLVKMKNAFLDLQDSDFLDMTLKLYKNILMSGITKVSYADFIKNCATENADIFLTNDLNIEESGAFSARARKSILIDNICSLWNRGDMSSGISPDIKEDAYNILREIAVYGKRLYSCRKKPDMDISKIFTLLMDCIKSMKKELPGCERAIEMIERSSHLFTSNYKTYYKGMVHTGNPISMIEEFTCDVIKSNSDGTAKDLSQLRKLSRHIRKLINKNSGGTVPAHVKDMMEKLDVCFDSFLDTPSDDANLDSDKLNEEFEKMM